MPQAADQSEASPRSRRPGRPHGAASGAGRAALLQAARDLMAEKGLPRVTAREVAERAGVKPTLVNYYFGSRDGLLRAVVEAISKERLADLAAVLRRAGSAEERLRALVAAMVDGFARDSYAPRLLIEQIVFGEDETLDRYAREYGRGHIEAIVSVLDAERAEGRLRDIDPVLAICTIGGVCLFQAIMRPLLGRLLDLSHIEAMSSEQIAAAIADILENGLVPRAALPA